MAQYPLDMGRQDKPRSDSTLAVTVGADGNVNYDAIVKQGRNKDKYIATTHDAMVPKLDRLKDVRSLPTYLWLVPHFQKPLCCTSIQNLCLDCYGGVFAVVHTQLCESSPVRFC